jgi:hypothetical protein
MPHSEKKIVELRPRRVVKVRINASGRRLIGCIELPEGYERISDVLNSPDPCLLLTPHEPLAAERGEDGSQVIFKDAVTYLEAVEEPRPPSSPHPAGEFRPVVAELREPEAQQVIAEIFVPEGQTLLQILSDARPFINLRNVHFTNFVERYAFLAISKRQLILVKT